MGIFERLLSVWVGLAIIAGVVLGSFMPGVFAQVAGWELAGVNVPVAVLIWLMIYPMMAQVDFSSMRQAGANPKGLMLTLLINWAIKPFTMAALGVLFFKYIFAPWVDPATAEEYIAGMILLGVAPCTAMVFIWSQLTKGNANYTLVQVSVNDVIMVVAFAPIAGLLLGVTDITVPWQTLLASVVLYVLLPLVAGVITRYAIFKQNAAGLEQFLHRVKPLSILGLIATVVLLFGFQAPRILAQPLAIVMIAIPLLLQTYGIFALSYWWAKRWRLSHDIAAPACLIGTSNFFELAVAVAISLFGLNSGAALATVVGVLVEVPVMLSLVAFANRTRHWFN
ncbi:ACR3 family arsenite efflux transporter [Gilvimarinus agarilyticus]|uniref:ACR3 family arsenite efflux transporter n=1 Tax=Gilvimarinus sp. 2_MG-2023 TaxID=3062666 RepID=UPI001C09C350|nr:ACR3 family arsenite efflux transporter [Gilvimarinus sp. 2_MG-2023]MBU2887818.1 ACR3 family arsenite efflux transporter [Gilvimarinus agarilyticus]MDO6572456.1 ACR3 family arsenite efflux transporter [Gilvimarinus sp. 2_MG-2023]